MLKYITELIRVTVELCVLTLNGSIMRYDAGHERKLGLCIYTGGNMELGHSLELSQKLQLSQTQIQALELLAMDSAELEQYLQQEYLENPLLEYDKKSADREAIDIFAGYSSSHDRYEAESDPEVDEDDRRRDIPAAQEISLKQFILDQLPRKGVNRALVEYLTECLDGSGFFTMAVEEAAGRTGCTQQEISETLDMLRELEPYGIFAADMRECLLKQLQTQEMED